MQNHIDADGVVRESATGLPLARVAAAPGETIAADDVVAVVPTVRMAKPKIGMEAAIAGQIGRLQEQHKGRHANGPSNERNFYRADDKNRRKRQKKSNARRQRAHRDHVVAVETLRAQIRVASGQTSASPALVTNARRALEAKVAAVMTENPGMTEEQATEAVFEMVMGDDGVRRA